MVFCRPARHWVCAGYKRSPIPQVSLEYQGIIHVLHQLVELSMVRQVRSLHFTIEMWRSLFDINMPNAQVFAVPMEQGLEHACHYQFGWCGCGKGISP